ncbi:unnamed protein product [marine sediment metagenome]|uniref:S1 motif domain-containing protein n=1 Tax=marine sediment metagenome TaxID=412755 RepID=X0YKR7_9ZZZZ
MNKRVIIDVVLTEERVAVIEAGRLVEIHIERIEDDKIVGNIYKGKVTNVLPGIEAAFVDIGIEKNAFLHIDKTANWSSKWFSSYLFYQQIYRCLHRSPLRPPPGQKLNILRI